MIKISITRNSILTNQASFSTMEEAQSWLATHEGMKTFGEPASVIQQEFEVSSAVLAEDGSVVQEAVTEMRDVPVPGSYEVLVEDISSKVAQEVINAEALAFLAECDWKRQRHISQKALNIPTSLTEEAYLAMERECQNARESVN